MSVADIISILGFGGGGGLVLILALIQVSKIQFNPWDFICKVIGRGLAPGVLEELKKEDYFASKESINEMEIKIKKDVDDLRDELDKKDLFGKADYYHDQIMLSADKLKAGKIPSQERGRSLYRKIIWYENLCKEYPEYDNGVCPNACKFIKKWYIETYGYTKGA